MGIYCEIKLFKPADGAYIPGSFVTGAIKYALDEDTVFSKITLSLKGKGVVIITNKKKRRQGRTNNTYRSSEEYVDIDNVIHDDTKNAALPIGSYETPFSFQLPQEIPASLVYNKSTSGYWVRSKIGYYVRIKFERPGFLQFAKRFKKELTVVSGIKPKLPTEPIIHGEQRKLFQLFGGKDNIVNVKATIENSVIRPGGQVKFNYEIFNDTNLSLKGVETKIVEIHSFNYHSRKVKMFSDVSGSDAKTGAIKSGETENDSVVVNIPSDITSLEFSKIVARDYFIYITTNVPFPHRNVVVKIPIQIGDELKTVEDVQNIMSDPPPSYWEAMGEDDEKKEMIDD